ncbi:MAG TPA: SUMF1/EgtB/PvdO family nonheme iron enzyme [Polyangiaceae bacterium]|nr:SUMF1/EgtB/PvdO family nonheme iron enzyme [Polyangiaceae bacterium]
MTHAPTLALGVAALLPLLTLFPSPAMGARARLGQSRIVTRSLFDVVSNTLFLRERGSLMVRIEKSTATFGSNEYEVVHAAALCADEPLPQRCTEHTFENELYKRQEQVRAFWIDRYEVTVRDYQRCVSVGRCEAPPYANGAERFNRPDYPVSFVTHADAVAYCRFRNARLPREAEFERAARGVSGRKFPWGELYNAHVANHGRLGVLETDASDGYPELAPVGAFPDGKTPEVIFDLAGNVAEWQAEPYRENSNQEVPAESEAAPRVARGGGFLSSAAFLRGAAREAVPANTRRPDLGLRCARSAQDSAP